MDAPDATGATLREYIWLPGAGHSGTDLPLAVVDGVNTALPALYHVHADHLGRPVRMTDGAKATVWAATWLPWGAPYQISGALTLDARFPGQWYQLEAGLHYNWHRHYDPTLGRYTQPDPLGFVDGPSMYAYVRGQPLQAIDLDGRTSRSIDPSPSSGKSQCSPKIALKDTCQKCLSACDGGAKAIESFCRTTPMPPVAKALCWAAVYTGRNACRGYCFNNHCSDVQL